MKNNNQKNLQYFRRYIRLIIAVAILLGLFTLFMGMEIKDDGIAWKVMLKLMLMEIGVTVLVSSTIGIFLTETYEELRNLTIDNEIFNLVDRLNAAMSKPSEFKTFQLITHLERAGVLAFYPTRKGPAQEDLNDRLEQLLHEDEKTTILLMGDTLRVFFGEGPFSYKMVRIVSEKPNVFFRVLLLNPNSWLALVRSEAETVGAPFKTDEEYHHGATFNDSKRSTDQILEWNRLFFPKREKEPINLRFYDVSDYCLSVIFPDVCYTAQYLYADPEAQFMTPELPMIKYKADSIAHKRLTWNFNYIWNNHSIAYTEMAKTILERPIVATIRGNITDQK
jgi:hypothetical protein